jgi:TetR/AcrR family transcriptional regulator, lmrAB and yxaGH operons repressor
MGRKRLEVEVDVELALMFRAQGFDGVTLSDFERQTGMARASLYYRYPDGKDSMARTVLGQIAESFRDGLLAEVDAAAPQRALKILQSGLLEYYDNGRLGCILGAFSSLATAAKFRSELQVVTAVILSCIERLAHRLGAPKADARRRAENFLADLQGSLVLAAIADSPRLFARRLAVAITTLQADAKAAQ